MPVIKNALLFLLLGAISVSSTALAQTRVKADELSNLSIIVERSVTAEVVGLTQTGVSSRITAEIHSLPLLVGQQVEDDQVIGMLDCVDNELALKAANAEYGALDANRVLVEKQLSRLEKLRLNRNASEEQINQKQAEVSSIKARLSAQSIAIQIAKRQIEKCLIITPFKGVVTEVHSEEGSFAVPGTLLFSMMDPDDIELHATLTSTQLEQITHHSLYFLFDQNILPVELRTILPLLDSISQTREVRLTFPQKKPLSGTKGRLQWILPGTILPSSLVVEREGKRGIFAVEEAANGEPIARFIELDNIAAGQPAMVDLETDTLVITDGRFGLTDGDKIELE